MKRMIVGIFVAALSAILGNASFAAEWATKEEAVAMVKKAVVFIKEQGPQKLSLIHI